MPTFEELLKQQINGMNARFQEADRDLHQVVAESAEIVMRISNGNSSLRLSVMGEDSNGITYSLQLSGKVGTVNLCNFRLNATGYPVIVNNSSIVLADKGAILSFLTDLAGNPDSPLVQQLAFFVQKK